MKYAIYVLETSAVMQWQDTDVDTYPELGTWQGRIELAPEDVPPEFALNVPPIGFWVVDGALSRVPPPPTIKQLAAFVSGSAFNRAQALLGAATYSGVAFFGVSEDTMVRLRPIAVSPDAFPGVSSVDFQEGAEWRTLSKADLSTALVSYMTLREAFSSAWRAHSEAIELLRVAEDRAGLEAYDVDAGWPSA